MGQCNTGSKSTRRSFKTQGLSRALIQTQGYFVQVRLREARQIGFLGQVLSQTVGLTRPVLVVVAEINSTITRWLTRGWARQFLADEGEEPVLDLVPLAGAGRAGG